MSATMLAHSFVLQSIGLMWQAFYVLADAIRRCENCGKPLPGGEYCVWCGWDNATHQER